MMPYRSCDGDPDLYRKVKEAVTIQQAARYCGLKEGQRGLCLCPFHQDQNPSMKLYPNGKGFYCFACGAGGDQISLVARYYGIRNREAAEKLAAAFQVPVRVPVTYREKRKAALAGKRKQEQEDFVKRSRHSLRMYWILLCEARRDLESPHFEEGIQKLDYVEYLLECLDTGAQSVWEDKRVVRWIEEVEERIAEWHVSPREGGTVPG